MPKSSTAQRSIQRLRETAQLLLAGSLVLALLAGFRRLFCHSAARGISQDQAGSESTDSSPRVNTPLRGSRLRTVLAAGATLVAVVLAAVGSLPDWAANERQENALNAEILESNHEAADLLSGSPGQRVLLRDREATLDEWNRNNLAKGRLHQVRELREDDLLTLANLGNAHLVVGELDQAEHYYARCLELDVSAAYCHYGQGVVYWERGELEKAEDSLYRSVELAPYDRVLRLGVASRVGSNAELTSELLADPQKASLVIEAIYRSDPSHFGGLSLEEARSIPIRLDEIFDGIDAMRLEMREQLNQLQDTVEQLSRLSGVDVEYEDRTDAPELDRSSQAEWLSG